MKIVEPVLEMLGKAAFANAVRKELARLGINNQVVNTEDVDILQKDHLSCSECQWCGNGVIFVGKFFHFFSPHGFKVEITRRKDTKTYQLGWYNYVPEKQTQERGELAIT